MSNILSFELKKCNICSDDALFAALYKSATRFPKLDSNFGY